MIFDTEVAVHEVAVLVPNCGPTMTLVSGRDWCAGRRKWELSGWDLARWYRAAYGSCVTRRSWLRFFARDDARGPIAARAREHPSLVAFVAKTERASVPARWRLILSATSECARLFAASSARSDFKASGLFGRQPIVADSFVVARLLMKLSITDVDALTLGVAPWRTLFFAGASPASQLRPHFGRRLHRQANYTAIFEPNELRNPKGELERR